MPYYTYKVLGQANPAAATTTTLYTVPAITNTIVSTITVCNQAATTATYTIAVRPYGATLDPKHYINYNAAIPALDTIGLTMGMTLNATDVISVLSSNASTSFNVFGTQITDDVPITSFLVDYLVVGGGGSGFRGKTGTYWGGGGGAGQVVGGGGYSIYFGTVYDIIIGAGGLDQTNLDINGNIGNFSSAFSITAAGGGGGLYNTGYGGTSGNGYIGGAPPAGVEAGGGGGAGAAGSGQNAGNGITSSISGASTYYGGGGSAGRGDGNTVGTAGLGGGGSGSNTSIFSDAACRGVSNTGGGGGGGGGSNNKGSAGGSGIVIIRYADTYDAATATTGSPTITVSGGYRTYKFTSSGSITF